MRIKIVGESDCAKATRQILRKGGFSVTEFLPQDLLANVSGGYVITIEEMPGLDHIYLDSSESDLEHYLLRHITQLCPRPVIIDRPGGQVHSDQEIRIVIPQGNESCASSVEYGVLRGFLDLFAPAKIEKLVPPTPVRSKFKWLKPFFIALLFLAPITHAQQLTVRLPLFPAQGPTQRPFTYFNQVIQQGGSAQTPRRALNLINGANVTITCVDNSGSGSTDCTFASSGGGGGSGCVPSSTTANALLKDTGAGTCDDITKWTSNGTTTITGAATAILDLSAAATIKVPTSAGYAPTASETFGYDSTANKYVFGQNGSTVSFSLTGSPTGCTNQFVTAFTLTATGAPTSTCTTATLAGAQFANQGTTTTVLHGNGAGNPAFGSVVSADLNITTTTCTNQFVTAISSAVAGTCTTDTLASAQHANQGTTTTVLHGAAAGNPSFGAVALATDVSGQLPIGSVGSAGLSATSPVAIASTGAITCTTCNVWSSLTNPSGSLALSMAGNTSIFSTTTALSQMFAWKNTTAAVVGTSQSSPILADCGRGFHASADEEECATLQILPGNGNDAAGTIAVGHSGSGAGVYTSTFPGPIQAGTSSTAGALLIPQGSANGHTAANNIVIEAPAAVTAYEELRPAAAATGLLHMANSSSVVTDTISAVSLSADVTGQLPIAAVGSAGLSATSPVAIASTGAITCTTCTTNASALTANLPVIGAGGQASAVGTRTGNTTQFASWTGATTATRCVDTDASGNLQVTAADCGTGGGSSNPAVSNITPVTVNANSTGDQQAQELSLSAAYLNTATQPFLFHGSGIFSTTLVPAVTVKFKLCSVSGCGSGTVVTLATMTTANTTSATNNQIIADMSCATHAIGATGNLICHGILATDLTASSVLTTTYSDANTAVSSNFDLTAAWFVDTSIAFSTGSASNSFTEQEMWLAPLATPVATSIACSGVTNGVCNNAANTGTTAMTLDMSASTTANSFKAPIGAGLTSGADGAIAYDTTGKLTHVRTNGADSSIVAATGTSTTTTQVLHATAVAGIGTFSAIATGDLPTISTTVNGQTCTIGSTCAVESATSGQVAISGGSGAALTGAADLTYSTHTFSGISTTIFDLSAATGTAAFKIPSTTTNTATAASVIDYDTTNSNYHANSGADSLIGVVPTASVPATGDIIDASVVSSKFLLHDSGVATANVVTAASNGTTKQICTVASSNKACTWIDFPDVKVIPAANCNNATGGNGWSIGSGGTVSCRAGTNNLGGFVQISDTSSTFATFQVPVPEDWDTAVMPYLRVSLSSSDATNSHTVIPSESVACYVGDGTGTDDIAQNATRSLSTVTLNGNANRFWSTSNLQLNSTDMTNCVGGSTMQVTIGRATDTATAASVRFYSATLTFPRLLVVQAD